MERKKSEKAASESSSCPPTFVSRLKSFLRSRLQREPSTNSLDNAEESSMEKGIIKVKSKPR